MSFNNAGKLNFTNRTTQSVLFALFYLIICSATTRAASVDVVWNPCTNNAVTSYKIYYGTASQTYTNTLTVGNVTNVLVSNLTAGVTYYFAAKSCDALGDESAAFSKEASFAVPLDATNTATTNQPPTLNSMADLTINENTGMQTVGLSGITSGSASENQTLIVTAASSNPSIIPSPTVNYTSPNTTGTLTFTPVTDAYGTATITVTVNDGGASNNVVTQSFTVNVNPVNQPPTLNPIADLTINQNADTQTIDLSGITSGASNEIQTLNVTATSSNTRLIKPSITYTSPNTTGILTFKPTHNHYGSATISVTVDDGGPGNNLITQTFTVTVFSPSGGVYTSILPEPAPTLTVESGTNGQFTLTASGVSGNTYIVEASKDLVNWIPIQTNIIPTNASAFTVVDPEAGLAPQRFYRTHSLP